MSVFSPCLEDVPYLPTKLNPGEEYVLDALKLLDDEWHVYIQPMLLMDNPDFVIVHNHYGVSAIEVKNWQRSIYRQNHDGTIECYNNMVWRKISETPEHQAFRYRNTIFEHFFATPESGTCDFPVVRAAIILPQYNTYDARNLLRNPHNFQKVIVWGGDALENNLLEVLTGYKKPKGMRIPRQSVIRLHRQLAEPEMIADQRQPLKLSLAAKNIEKNPNRAKIRRVRGAAGSGKSLGLAARAAKLASEKQKVLVLSFNITLPHYLHDLAARHGRQLGVRIRNITFTHFHGFCGRIASDGAKAGVEGCHTQQNNSISIDLQLDLLVSSAANAYQAGVGTRFDAILVDEGQDFKADWWNFLRHQVLQSGGELLLVVDATQDIYTRASWTAEKVMRYCGFRGPWTELPGSYRMPADIVPIIARFGELYLTDGAFDPPIVPMDHPMLRKAVEPTIRHWINIPCIQELSTALTTEIRKMLDRDELAPADIVFLCEEHAYGLNTANLLETMGVYVSHVFTKADNDERRRRKNRFWGGMDGVKGCTVHSFKGWEAHGVVLCILPNPGSRRLAYVALTRLKGDPGVRSVISVINCDPNLNEFKTEFERKVTVDEVPALGGQRRLF